MIWFLLNFHIPYYLCTIYRNWCGSTSSSYGSWKTTHRSR